MIGRCVWIALSAVLLAAAARAAGPPQDPDWPCVQRLVPEIAAESVWSGPALPGNADWRADPALSALVAAVTPRAVDAATGVAKINAFLDALPKEQRAAEIPEAFLGILAGTNEQRQDVIARIKGLNRRQRDLAHMVVGVTDELAALPTDATGAEADQRAEMVQRQAYELREFQETQRTMRYACEAPVQLEARLGAYARALQSKL